MIGLDTNVLVRYLAQDHPFQSPRATELIEHTLSLENPGFVGTVAMVETAWVLASIYKLSDRELAAKIEHLLAADVLFIEHESEVHNAMTALEEGRGDFADALLAALDRKAGCSHTLTFDRKASRLSGFMLLS